MATDTDCICITKYGGFEFGDCSQNHQFATEIKNVAKLSHYMVIILCNFMYSISTRIVATLEEQLHTNIIPSSQPKIIAVFAGCIIYITKMLSDEKFSMYMLWLWLLVRTHSLVPRSVCACVQHA